MISLLYHRGHSTSVDRSLRVSRPGVISTPSGCERTGSGRKHAHVGMGLSYDAAIANYIFRIIFDVVYLLIFCLSDFALSFFLINPFRLQAETKIVL